MAETEMLWRFADAALEAGDFGRARELWERGAALGDPHCWVGLGFMFDVGQGVEIDKDRAMHCYMAAWRSRNAVAANNIAVLYREKGDRWAMFRWFKRAAEQGDVGAYLEMAKCYRDGIGVAKSHDEAVRCLARAMSGTGLTEGEREEAGELLASARPRTI